MSMHVSQVYLLLSCCPCEGRISGIVDIPNAVATLAIPMAIFDRDVRPKEGDVLQVCRPSQLNPLSGRNQAYGFPAVPPEG